MAAHNLLAGNRATDFADFTNVPVTVFTFPAAAQIGLTPGQPDAQGVELIHASYNFGNDSRVQIFGETAGSLHLYFAPGSQRLQGAWIVGIDAGYLIGEIGLAYGKGLTAYDLAAFSDQHPMSSEGISQAARSLFSGADGIHNKATL